MAVLAFATPRKLPKASSLKGRVVVLDIAFAGMGGGGYEKVTKKFIDALGERLIGWVDHHDHDRHGDFHSDSRFVLATKAEHGACPEMVTPEVIGQLGEADTILCHTDFDGLASAAKWILGGKEPYPGCDQDAHAVDTRLGEPSETGKMFDRALRARPRDESLFRDVVGLLVVGLRDEATRARLTRIAEEMIPIEKETRRAARAYRRFSRRTGGGVALVDVAHGFGRLDKTSLLLLGQQLEQISIVVDEHNVTMAAAFDSGVNFLQLLGLDGGMPTRVSLSRGQLDEVLDKLSVDLV